MSRLALRRDIQTCFKRISLDDEPRPRTKAPVVGVSQIAARLGLTYGVLKGLIDRGELPAPPKPRVEGDRYDRACERAWRRLTPERRQTLVAVSERDYVDYRDDDDGRPSMRQPKISISNRSGARGVTRIKKAWVARIFENGKNRSLGSFDTVEDASAAYEAALAQKLARKG